MSLKKIKAAAAKKFVKSSIEAQRRKDTAQHRKNQALLDSGRKEDGWVNTLSGVGDPFNDKRMSSFFLRDAVNWQSAEDLWRSDDIAARAVECLPDEMTREGFQIVIQHEATGTENHPENAASNRGSFGDGDNDGDDYATMQSGAGTHAPARHDAAPSLSMQGADNPGSGDNSNAAVGGSLPAAPPESPQPEEEGMQETDLSEAKAISELMMNRCDDLDVLNKVRQALYFSRAYGGGAILVGANDGEMDWSKPLREDRIQSIDYLNVLEPRELLPVFYYGDPRAPKYGEPMIYQLNRIMIAGEVPADQAYLRIHESRLIRFDGIRVGRRQIVANAGWGDSIFTRVIQVTQDFQNVWQGAALIMSDFGQAVLKIKGLAEMVAKNGKNAVQARAQAVSLSRSVANMVLLDSEEEFSRMPTPMSGFPEMLDRFCNRLAAALKTPVTILMGQAPAGLNATGQSDLEWFSNQVRAEQQRHLRRPMERLIKLLFLDKAGVTRGLEPNNWSVNFPSLKQMSDLEKAEIRLKTSQADASDVQNDILLPAEVAKSRYGGDEYSTETQVDLELREQTRKAASTGIDEEYHTGRGEPGARPALEQPQGTEPDGPRGEESVAQAGANKPALNPEANNERVKNPSASSPTKR
jgi:phage-related protein (TIGR01555 family)